jgi:hypothetical protein
MTPVREAINLLIWMIVFTILDALLVGLRFWAAFMTRRAIYADDYLIVFSLATTWALQGVMIWGIFNGMGMNTVDLTPKQLSIQLQLIPAAYVTWTVATTAFKLSVLFLYIRIMSWPILKRLSYTIMGLSMAYCISFMAVFLTTCTPDISQLWNPRPDGHCRDLNIGQLGSVSTNLGLDVLIIALPMPFLWRLQMPRRNKIVVTLAFSLGFITIGIMIWRIYDLVTSANNPQNDFVRHLPTLALTTTLELWICIIIACVPTIGPIVRTHLKPIITKLSGGSDPSRPSDLPLHKLTFGRGRFGSEARSGYVDMLMTQEGEEEQVGPPARQSNAPRELGHIRKETVTTTKSTARPPSGESMVPFTAEVGTGRQHNVQHHPWER